MGAPVLSRAAVSAVACGLLSYDVGGIRWWRCLLSRVGLAEPGEPDEYGPDE